jgi:hypothetical protein
VQSDEAETSRRNDARIGQPGGPASAGDLREWMAEEVPFVAGQRSWERADLVVCGTPEARLDDAGQILVAPRPPQGHTGGPAA